MKEEYTLFTKKLTKPEKTALIYGLGAGLTHIITGVPDGEVVSKKEKAEIDFIDKFRNLMIDGDKIDVVITKQVVK